MTDPRDPADPMSGDGEDVDRFWAAARHRTRVNPVPGYLGTYAGEALAPPVWAFGATPDQADRLLDLVLDGTKTATASAVQDYEAADEPLPRVGDLGIVLDGAGHPRALLETLQVDVTPFDQVDAEHARLEGEGDLSLAAWRDIHERYFSENGEGFTPSMPVVLERFAVLFP